MARRKKGEPISGWVIIDKPEGLTSTDVVNKCRRTLNAQKAGHAGTLDPLATGVLAVAFGEATKTIPFVMDADKVYRFTVAWGEARSTDDCEGEVTERSDVRPSRAAIEAVLPQFIGAVEQVPPAFSAIKVDGERAYDLARAGEDVQLKARTVHIDEITLVDLPDADHAVFEMACGKGTYVRALARDMAKALGTAGHIADIRRLKAGPMDIERAIPLEQWLDLVYKAGASEALLPVETPLDDIPALAVTEADAVRLRNGQPILLRDDEVLRRVKALSSTDEDEDPPVLCSRKGRPVALCRYDRGELHPSRVFNIPL